MITDDARKVFRDGSAMGQPSQYLVVEAERQGCLGFEGFFLKIELVGDAATLRVGQAVTGGGSANHGSPRPIALHEANKIAGAVRSVLDRPQRLAGGRSTEVTRVRVSLNQGHSTMEWHMETSDIPVEGVWDVLPFLAPEKQEQIRVAYEGYFNWAHELLKLVREIVSERQLADRYDA